MKIEKQMFGLCAVLSALSLTAGTYTWTGAQDACWTNAANWTVGGAVATASSAWDCVLTEHPA